MWYAGLICVLCAWVIWMTLNITPHTVLAGLVYRTIPLIMAVVLLALTVAHLLMSGYLPKGF